MHQNLEIARALTSKNERDWKSTFKTKKLARTQPVRNYFSAVFATASIKINVF
jgi:hypothetical protein